MADEQVNQQEVPTQDVSKKRYEYQPKDDEGRPLGGMQVVEYADEQELADEMAKRHTESMRYARRLKRDAALGIPAEGEVPVPADYARTNGYTEFKPKSLTPEEKWEISRGLADPDKFDEAADRLLESRLGARPDAIRQTLTQAQNDIQNMRAQAEAQAFVDSNQGYYVCAENSKTMLGWMAKHGLAPTKANFEYVYERLKAAELLLDAPIAAEEDQANTQPEPEPEGRITPEVTAPTKRPAIVSTGLTKANSSSAGGGSTRRGYSEDEISKMSTAEYQDKVLKPLLRKSQR